MFCHDDANWNALSVNNNCFPGSCQDISKLLGTLNTNSVGLSVSEMQKGHIVHTAHSIVPDHQDSAQNSQMLHQVAAIHMKPGGDGRIKWEHPLKLTLSSFLLLARQQVFT